MANQTNQQKLKEVFGENFTITSFPVGGKYKSYAILQNDLTQVAIETWLGMDYIPVNGENENGKS